MPDINDITEQYTLDFGANTTQFDAATNAAAQNLNRMETSAQQAAAAVAGLQASITASAASINNVNEAIKLHSLTMAESTFIYRTFAREASTTFALLAAGVDPITVLTSQLARMGAELTSRHGFRILREEFTPLIAAIGGWPTVAAGAIAAGFVVMAYEAETTARAIAALSQELSGTRADFEATAEAIDRSSHVVADAANSSVKDALKAQTEIAKIPGTAADDINHLSITTLQLSKVLGNDLNAAIKLVTESTTNQSAALKTLAEKFPADLDPALQGTIANMIRLGQSLEATAALHGVEAEAAKKATDQVTPLQAAMQKLSLAFTTAGTDGKGFAQAIGESVTQAVADAVKDIAFLIEKLQQLRGLAGQSLDLTPEGIAQSLGAGVVHDFLQRQGLTFDKPGDANRANVDMLPGQIQASAATHNLDPAFLTALQHQENAAPNASGFWNTSESGAQGAMQIMYNTFRDMRRQPGTFPTVASMGTEAIGDQGQNVEIGAALAVHLLQKYGSVRLAVLAYHDGEPRIDDFLKGIGQPSQKGIAEADRVLANYGGTGFAGGGTPPPSQDAVAADKRLSASRGVEDFVAMNAQVDGLNKKLRDLNNEREAIASKPTLDPQDVIAVLGYDKAIAQTSVELEKATNQLKGQTDAAADNARSAGMVEGAQRTLYELQVKIDRQRADNPNNAISEADGQALIAAKTDELRGAYDKELATLERHISQTNEAAKAAAGGAEATLKQKAYTEAFNDTLKAISKTAPDFTEKVIALAAAKLKDATAQQAINSANETFTNGKTIAFLQLEISTLGQDADQRALLLQGYKDLIDVQQKYFGQGQDVINQHLAERQAIAQLTQSYQQHQDALNYLSGQVQSAFQTISDSMASAFVNGKGQAVDWGNVLRGVLQKVISQLLELAVFNPIINELFGGSGGKTLPTLGGVVGALFGSGGNAQQATSQQGLNAQQVVSLIQASSISGGNTIGQGSANLTFIDPTNPSLGFASSGGGGAIGGNLSGGGGSLSDSQVLSLLRGGVSLGGATSSGGSFLGTASNLFSIAGTAQKLGLFGSSSSGGGVLDLFGLGDIGSKLGLTGSNGIFSGIGSGISSFLNTPLFGAGSFFGPSLAEATSAITPASAGLGAFDATGTGVAAGAASTIGDFIGGVGAGFTAGSLVGGLVQRGAGKVGPGPQIGAGVGAIGGAIAGTLIFPGVGTLIGGLIGGVLGGSGGGLIGPKAKSPYSQTLIGLLAGGAGLEKGITNSQLVDGAGESAQAAADIKQINAALSASGAAFDLSGPLLSASGDFGGARTRDTINSFVGANNTDPQAQKTLKSWGLNPTDIAWLQVGQNSPKGSQDPSKIADLNTDFWKFAFKSAEPLMNSFLQGTGGVDPVRGSARGFTSIDEFQNQTKVVKSFIDAISGTDFTSRVPDLFRNKLPQGGTAQDFQATLSPIVTFVNQTVPQLLKIGSPAGSLADTISGLNDQFKAAIGTAHDLGYKEQELTATRDRAIAAAQDAARQQLARQDASFDQRLGAANVALDPNNAGLAQSVGLQAIDTRAQQEREDFTKSLRDTFGDAYLSTQGYVDQITKEELVLQKERLVGIKQLADAAKQQTDSARSAATSTLSSLRQFVTGLETGAASPASPSAQLSIAQSNFATTATKAQGGDAAAIQQLQGDAATLLNQAKSFYGSTSGYTAVFNEVTAGLKGVAALSDDQLTAAFFKAQTTDQTTALDNELEKLRKEIGKLEDITSGVSADPEVIAQISQKNAEAINTVSQQTATAALATSSSVTQLIAETKTVSDTQAYTNVLLVQYLSWGFGVVNQAIVNAANSNWAGQQWMVGQLNNLQSWDDSLIIGSINTLVGAVRSGAATGGFVWDSAWNVGSGGGLEGGQRAGGWIGLATGGTVVNGMFDKDSVAARYRDGSHIMLAGGEFVVTARQAMRYGEVLKAINAGSFDATARSSAATAGHFSTQAPVRGQHHSKQMGGFIDGGSVPMWDNDNSPVVHAMHNTATLLAIEIRTQTSALLEALASLTSQVAAMRAEAKQTRDRPGRLAA